MATHFFSRQFATRAQLVNFINGNDISKEDIINLKDVTAPDKYGRSRVVANLDFYHSGNFFYDFFSKLPELRREEIKDNAVLEETSVFEEKKNKIERDYNKRIERNKTPPPKSIEFGGLSISNTLSYLYFEDPQELEFEKNYAIANARIKHINFNTEDFLVFVNSADEPTDMNEYHNKIISLNDGLKLYYISTSTYLSQKENKK
jgi:hypothetical protein